MITVAMRCGGEAAKTQSRRVAETQSHKVAESQSRKVAESQSHKVAESQSHRVAESQRCGVAEFCDSAKIVLGKAFTNVMIYSVFSVFFLGLLPLIFHLPHLGDSLDIIIMMIPYLFASVFFCLSLSPFYTDSDMPLFIIVFMSVPLVFLSGISYPLELMPWHWKIFHYLIPTAPATLAFVKLDCMGGDLTNIRPEMITLWIQCAVYFVVAVLVRRRIKITPN